GQQSLGRVHWPHALAKGLVQDRADLGADVDADFVQQGEGSNREAKAGQRLVDAVDGHALLEQVGSLVHVRRENAVDVEAGAVLDHDHCLALLAAHLDRGGDDLGAGPVGGDDFQQRHLVDWREVVHADDVRGAGGRLGDAADGNGRGVGGEDGVFTAAGLDVLDHPMLEREILEDRLDHQVQLAEAAVVQRGGDPVALQGGFDGRDVAPLQPPLDEFVDVLHAAAQGGGVAVLEADWQAGAGRGDVGNAGAHEAGAQYPDPAQLARTDVGVRDAAVFLQLG